MVQVEAREPWIRHADQHAEARRVSKGATKVNKHDVAGRVAEIAFATMARQLGALSGVLRLVPGGFLPPIELLDGATVSVRASAADKRYNLGAKASLSIYADSKVKAGIYVLGVYHPPFVDFLGWAPATQVETSPLERNRRVVPCRSLRPVASLTQYMRRIGRG